MIILLSARAMRSIPSCQQFLDVSGQIGRSLDLGFGQDDHVVEVQKQRVDSADSRRRCDGHTRRSLRARSGTCSSSRRNPRNRDCGSDARPCIRAPRRCRESRAAPPRPAVRANWDTACVCAQQHGWRNRVLCAQPSPRTPAAQFPGSGSADTSWSWRHRQALVGGHGRSRDRRAAHDVA